MKLLFLNTDIGYGGAEKMIVWLANKCAEKGHKVSFFTYRDNRVMQPLSPQVKHIHVQLESGGAGLSMFKTARYLHQYIKEEKFDVGIAFLSPSMLRLAIKLKVFGKMNIWAFKQADYYVFQTSMAQAYFSKNIQQHSTVIANPIHPLVRTVERKGNIEKKIVTVGRLDLKQKRQDVLIEAFNIISAKYPNYKLEIYGNGEDEALIKNMAKTNDHIKLMGKTSKVAEVIQNAAVFVLSSDFEGIPNALLEAMSIGVPCVAADCSPGGASMLIHNKKNGLLVPRSNAKAMAEAISFMLDNKQEAEQMASEAMKVNDIYSEDIISEKWKKVIEKFA